MDVMATTEEQEMAKRLREAYLTGRGLHATPGPSNGGYDAQARLVLADRAALVERAETAENERGEARAQRLRVAALLDARNDELAALQKAIADASDPLTPPADLDGYVRRFKDITLDVYSRGGDEPLGTAHRIGIAAVIAARDAWWE